jgi:hypothetical protein
MSKFWWSQQGKEVGVHWMNWSCMSKAKSSGGIGFRDFKCFNQALLAKQGWRIWSNPNSLVVWRVRNGRTIRIWKDKWIPNPSTYRIFSPSSILNPDATMSELLKGDPKWWNGQLLESIFTMHEVQLTRTLVLSSTNRLDVQIWRGTASGKFTIKVLTICNRN